MVDDLHHDPEQAADRGSDASRQERERLTASLRDSQERFRRVIESSTLGVHMYRLDPRDRLVFEGYNAAAATMLGVDHEPFLGKTLEEAFPQLAATEVPARYTRAALHGEPWRHEQLDYAEHAIRGVFEVRAFQTHHRSMAVMFQDITPQKQLEERLRLAQFSLDNCADGVFWMSVDAKLTYVNKAACERLGYTREELLRLSVFDIDPNFPQSAWQAHWQQIQEQRVLVIESQHRRKDGSTFPVEIVANFIDDGRRAFNCAFARDITERHRAAERLQHAHDTLEQRVEERTAELVRANEELREVTMQLVQSAKLAALGELSAGIAHELNQPLNAAKIICQGMQRAQEHSRLDLETVAAKLCSLVALIDRQACLIEHMGIFTRSSRDDELEPTDLREVVVGALTFTEQQLKALGIELQQDLPADPLLVRGDAVKLEQVLLNLLSNARWGVERSERDERSVWLRAWSEPGWAILTVSDNGVGIALEHREKIFQPFFTTKEPGEGTGLGLSISSKIVAEHGGSLSLLLRDAELTCFELRLPLWAP